MCLHLVLTPYAVLASPKGGAASLNAQIVGLGPQQIGNNFEWGRKQTGTRSEPPRHAIKAERRYSPKIARCGPCNRHWRWGNVQIKVSVIA